MKQQEYNVVGTLDSDVDGVLGENSGRSRLYPCLLLQPLARLLINMERLLLFGRRNRDLTTYFYQPF
jgi:hypothetical protein